MAFNLPSVPMDVDEKSNNTLSHKPSVKAYATRVLQESTVGMVSSIFSTHSQYRRFFKLLLSSLCTAGFIYHCVAFLNHVLGYPEVVNISSDRSETYNWPAYTYCSNNPIRRRVFCGEKPQYCVKPSEEFCKNFSSYCGANATLIPKKEYYYKLPDYTQARWILKHSIQMIYLSTFYSILENREERGDEIFGPYLRSSRHFSSIRPCYIIHSRVGRKEEPLKKKRGDSSYDERITFHLEHTEMINPRIEPGIYFSVHSPFEAVNPLRKGIFLKGGRTYNLYVHLQEEILLKAPFESNCMDYDELWEKNGRTGPRTKKMCKEKCYMEASLRIGYCVHSHNLYPNNERKCEDINGTRRQTEDEINILRKCRENCRDECRSLTYTTEHSIDYEVDRVDDDKQHEFIRVMIYLSNDEFKVLRHSPKYETVDVISSIGGFMGCWLGIALMDILDVFGSIITILRYALRKRL